MRTRRAVVLVVVAISSLLGICLGEQPWKTFRSAKLGYTVNYPASWRLGVEAGNLSIFNFPAGRAVHAIGLPVGGAEISILRAPVGILDIADWVKADDRGYVVLENGDVPVAERSAGGCRQITRIVTQVELTVPAWIFTTLYCESSGGPYRITLQNYKDDPKQKEYRRIVLTITESLRPLESAQ